MPPSEDKTAPYSFYHKSLFEFLEDGKRSGPLQVTFGHRHALYTTKYLDVCINKGFPNAPPAEQAELLDYFVDLDPFYEGSLLYSGDMHLLCDVEWWVRLFIAKQKFVKIRKAFIWAHRDKTLPLNVILRPESTSNLMNLRAPPGTGCSRRFYFSSALIPYHVLRLSTEGFSLSDSHIRPLLIEVRP
ncbi:hypothetical protein EST38_g10831 [Candolleomyces aberdarensis]|uniref:Uncharacterized protein n=1 Tax=Candolleomyces aberdarensis TaxID=2316362 RepID=A0A4Q2D6F4_9AGAR|nr:hypothetical protein EST38_g10831 [Candolleomyces aberdarensis]